MKIIFATPYYQSGLGIENRVTEIAKNLPNDIEKEIICLRKTRSPPRDIRVIQVPNIIHNLTAYRRVHFTNFSRLIRNSIYSWFLRSGDVVDAQYFPMTALPKFSKFIITWHSVTFPEYAPNHIEGEIWDKEYKYILNNMRRADMVIPVSKWAEKEVKNFDDSIPTTVIPNGVDLNKFRSKPLEKRGKAIISVGRFVPHKGHGDILMLFKEVMNELKDKRIKLILIGGMHDESYFEYLKKIGKSLGIEKNITFIPNVHDLHILYLYHLGDIFVSCSHWEGFGMPMLEAQACGLPALGYNICSHQEVAADRSFLAEENDISSIAENVKKLLTDDEFYRKSSSEARRFAEQYSWKNITKKYLETIRNL